MNNYFSLVNLSTIITILLLLQSCSFKKQIFLHKSIDKLKETFVQTTISISEGILDDSQNLSSIDRVSEPEKTLKLTAKLDIDKSNKLATTAKLLAGIAIESNSSLAQLQKQTSWQEHHRIDL